MFHKATLLSIVIEKVIEQKVIDMLLKEGVQGYTIYEGGGPGPFHEHPAEKPHLMDAFRILKIEVIISQRELAEKICHQLMENYFDKGTPGVTTLQAVEVIRSHKF